MNRLLSTIASVAITCTGASGAQLLTLEQCHEMAYNNYPLIEQYGLIEQSTDYTISNIKKRYLPSIQLSAQATYQSEAPDFPEQLKNAFRQIIDIHGMNKDQYKIALDINQTIWDGGQIHNDKKIAKAKQEESEADTDVKLYKLNSAINDLYFGILLIDESIKQNEEKIVLLESNNKRIHTHLKNGTAMQCDADAVEAELLTARQQNNSLRTRRQQYIDALCLFIGSKDSEISLSMPSGEIAAATKNNRPELALFEKRLQLLDTQRKSLNTAITPRFNFFANGFYGNPGLDYIENMMNPQWSWNYMIGITMRWNIGGLYTRKNDLQKINLQKKSVINERNVFLFNSDISVQRKKDEIEEYKTLLQDDDGIIRLRKSIREAAEIKMENGVTDVTDLLQKITEENYAKLNKAYHKIELLKAIYELKELTNN